MEVLSSPFNGAMKRYTSRKRYYKLDGTTNRKKIKVTRFGGKRKFWRIKSIPKLRLKVVSPLKLWGKLKDAYMNMMLNLAGSVGYLNSDSAFGTKRVPKARQVPMVYTATEFDERLILEIYKVLAASQELGTAPVPA
ncbi:hypothetical protein RJ641_006503 [Dillenia turbinata]|uniref:Uncharacterized protein n=1 Tax=Dillenia turbinata TaxID=194707 RepID=A0AAN8VIB4_9MAGN